MRAIGSRSLAPSHQTEAAVGWVGVGALFVLLRLLIMPSAKPKPRGADRSLRRLKAMAAPAISMGTAERSLATTGLMIAALMNSLDSTIANVALPHIQGALSAAQDQITWVLTSFIVATALMTPLTGWLSHRIGRKRLFLLSVASFVAVSILCGIATTLPEMVLFRLLQGLAGAAMIPVSQAFVLDLWPQATMPKVMAVWMAIILVGPIVGPTLGGLLTENYSWRWVFYINVPIGLGSFALVSLFLPDEEGRRGRPFDVLGFVALVLFTGAVQLVADRGPTLDWFDSREVCIEAIVAVCTFYVFVMQSLTAEHPFFDRGLFVDRNYSSAMIFMFFVAGMLFSTTALLPSFMQNLLGYSALQSGLTSMYRGLGSLVAVAGVAELSRRIGSRATIVIGLVIAASAMRLMSHFDLSMTATPIKVAGFVQGLGMGLMFGPLNLVGFATVPSAQRTEAAVFGNIVRSMAGSLGIASLEAVLIRQSAAAHEGLAAHISPGDPVIRWTLPHAFDAGGLEALNAEVTRQGAMNGYDAIFAGMAVVTLSMLLLVLIMRPARRGRDKLVEAHAE